MQPQLAEYDEYHWEQLFTNVVNRIGPRRTLDTLGYVLRELAARESDQRLEAVAQTIDELAPIAER